MSQVTRQKQVSIEQFLKACATALVVLKEGKIDNKGLTGEIAESLGLSVEDTEARYKRFRGQKGYTKTFEKFESKVPGGVEFATVGMPGRRGVSDEKLAEFGDLFDDIMSEETDENDNA